MKNKKILGGLVVVVVLLSGTTVLYFAGVERVGVTPATAVPPGGGGAPKKLAAPPGGICEVGFCARQKDRVPGCTTVPCCPTGEPYCDSVARVRSSSRQVLESSPTGSCWAFQGLEVDTCEYYQCGDAALCSNPACKEVATREWHCRAAMGFCGHRITVRAGFAG